MNERLKLLVQDSNKFLKKLDTSDWHIRSSPGSPLSIKDTLKQVESQKLELKESMFWMVKEDKGDKHFMYTVIKEIAGLMNNGGGELYVGVKDKPGAGRIIGLKRDFDWLETEYPGCTGEEKFSELYAGKVSKELTKTKFDKIISSEFQTIKGKTIFRIVVPHIGDVIVKNYKKYKKSTESWDTWKKVLFMRRMDHVTADSRDDGNGNRIDENGKRIA